MKQYKQLLADIIHKGKDRSDRTGVGTRSVFGRMLKFDLTQGFPAVTVKKLYFKSVAAELAGFLEATQSSKRMEELGTKIWTPNAQAWSGGDNMGRIYGVQWRKWDNQIDQLNQVVESIKREPNSRRHLVTAWNPSDLNDMCLPPCHYSFQFYVDGYYLNCLFNMRSVDVFLGLPFDIASYALLTELVAQDTNLVPGEMTVMLGDTHIYLNHFDQVLEVLERDPRPLPLLELDQEAGINNFHPNMARLAEYDPHPAVQAPLNV